ncbi:hypothetical protein [Oceaniovalibus sp. ACAM 378]|nr:hypothetical protein [Oceaniovalibus sp. ACAM 378]
MSSRLRTRAAFSGESADLAAALIRRAVLAEGCLARPLVLPPKTAAQ